VWRIWCLSLGSKASSCDKTSDVVAIVRTIIFLSYLITNSIICIGVIRHYNDIPNTRPNNSLVQSSKLL